jgi:hypothetical protein
VIALTTVGCGYSGQVVAPALGRLLAQDRVDLLLRHPLELLVVVEEAHRYWPGASVGPSPANRISQAEKMIAAAAAEYANTRVITPSRWS